MSLVLFVLFGNLNFFFFLWTDIFLPTYLSWILYNSFCIFFCCASLYDISETSRDFSFHERQKKKKNLRQEMSEETKKLFFFLIRRKKKKRRWKNFPLFLSGKITIFSIIFFSQHFSLHIILSPTFYLSLSLSISDRIYHRLWASSCLIFVCMQHISTRFDRNVTSYFE